jgi:hypothetical protein
VTSEQYERWLDFSTRMARTYPGRSSAFRKDIEGHVRAFIESHCRGGEDIADVIGWDRGENRCGYVTDHFETWWWDGLRFWENAPRDYYESGRDGEPAAFRRWQERWVTPINCCVRAGLDVASSPSAGVLGFNVGDLKRMYPEGIPAWVSEGYADKDGKPVDLNARDNNDGVWL